MVPHGLDSFPLNITPFTDLRSVQLEFEGVVFHKYFRYQLYDCIHLK
jgi:hypothetical protein